MSAKQQVPLADREFERILLIRLSALGDVVQTVALLNALRVRYPKARIDWLLKPSPANLVRHLPAVSNVLVYGENHTETPQFNWDGIKHFVRLMRDSAFRKLLRSMRSARYDLVVDVQCQMRTGFVTLVTGAPVRIGFGRARLEVLEEAGSDYSPGTAKRAWKGAREGSWLAYTHHIPVARSDVHAVDRYLKVGSLLGFDATRADFHFPIPDSVQARVDSLLAQHVGPEVTKRPIVISPAALWETKCWPSERFAAAARHFLEAGYPVVLVGSGQEADVCGEIATAVPGVADWSGRTSLLELAALIRRAEICLTNDSGPMHLAVALGRPVVSIFGPSDSIWSGPYGRESAVLNANLPCSPCRIRYLSGCPHGHDCMQKIEPKAVIARMEELLELEQRKAPAGEDERLGAAAIDRSIA